MKPVVADTRPINYLTLIGEADLLSLLFEAVWLPPAVIAELSHPDAPASVREFAFCLPSWCSVYPGAIKNRDELALLDSGERAAIELSLELGTTLIIDDAAGRDAAIRSGLAVTGTLGVLHRAAGLGLIDFHVILERLLQTNFWSAPALLIRLRDGSTLGEG